MNAKDGKSVLVTRMIALKCQRFQILKRAIYCAAVGARFTFVFQCQLRSLLQRRHVGRITKERQADIFVFSILFLRRLVRKLKLTG